jgi:hypothetical protein
MKSKEEQMEIFFNNLESKLDNGLIEDEKRKCRKILKVIKSEHNNIYLLDTSIPAIVYIVNNKYSQWDLTQLYRELFIKKFKHELIIGTSLTYITKYINQNVMKVHFPNIMNNFCTSDKMKRRVLINKLKSIIPNIENLFEDYLAKCVFLSTLQKEISRCFLKLIIFNKKHYSSSLEVMYYPALFPYIIYTITIKGMKLLYSPRSTYYLIIQYKETIEKDKILALGNIFNDRCTKREFDNAKKRLDYIFEIFTLHFKNLYKVIEKAVHEKNLKLSESYNLETFNKDKLLFEKRIINEEKELIKEKKLFWTNHYQKRENN